MKTKIFFISILIFTIFVSSFAAEKPTRSKTLKGEVVIDNLIQGLNSNNEGLKSSSAYYLGELKSTHAVIPLLRVLKDDPNDESRIMAALSLIKIGDGRGVYAVKQASKYDSSERVRKLCAGFYNDFLLNK